MATIEDVSCIKDVWNQVLLPMIDNLADLASLLAASPVLRKNANERQLGRARFRYQPFDGWCYDHRPDGVLYYLKYVEMGRMNQDKVAMGLRSIGRCWNNGELAAILPETTKHYRKVILGAARANRRGAVVTKIIAFNTNGKFDLRHLKMLIAAEASNATVKERIDVYEGMHLKLFQLLRHALVHYNRGVVNYIFPELLPNFDQIPATAIEKALNDLLAIMRKPSNNGINTGEVGYNRLQRLDRLFYSGWLRFIPLLFAALPEVSTLTHTLFIRWVNHHSKEDVVTSEWINSIGLKLSSQRLHALFGNHRGLLMHLTPQFSRQWINLIEIDGDRGSLFAQFYAVMGTSRQVITRLIEMEPTPQKLVVLCHHLPHFSGFFLKKMSWVRKTLNGLYADIEYPFDCIQPGVSSLSVLKHLALKRGIPVTQNYVNYLNGIIDGHQCLKWLQRVQRMKTHLENIYLPAMI